ncbi:hypothetical protein BofuT4_P049980.1 [Botrytis cinerea T4]|uniref:Uncharacterized protein n=1 Tax=Botryotinia fuckeliana (strain T4) TaxID=999810 RepID=G2XZU3_BOTF4|nr:hypothetical protein BofuT4_P049980.1 [Botrytis cinerea T4]
MSSPKIVRNLESRGDSSGAFYAEVRYRRTLMSSSRFKFIIHHSSLITDH